MITLDKSTKAAVKERARSRVEAAAEKELQATKIKLARAQTDLAEARQRAEEAERQAGTIGADLAGVVDTAEPVGSRLPDDLKRYDIRPGRPAGPRPVLCTLSRGRTWVRRYSPQNLVFERGVRVPITEAEFKELSEVVDELPAAVDQDGTRYRRRARKFVFHHAETGDLIELPPIKDEPVVAEPAA